jgi:hypothetical protein
VGVIHISTFDFLGEIGYTCGITKGEAMTDAVMARLAELKRAHWEAQQEIHKAIYHDGQRTDELLRLQRVLDKIYPDVVDLPPKSATKGGKWQGRLNPDPEV